MRRTIITGVLLLTAMLLVSAASARTQPAVPTIEDLTVVTRTDAFGQPGLFAEGQINNASQIAVTNVNLFAEVYDESDELIGEGFGFLVTACGAGLLPDFVLNPDHIQSFSIPLELYGEYTGIDAAEAAIDRVEVIPEFNITQPTTVNPELAEGVERVSRREVVSLEWVDAENLLFGVGCANDVFTELTWYAYTLGDDEPTTTEHPRADDVTEQLLTQAGVITRTQSGETDESLYFRSFLTFSPTARRVLFQNDLNVLISAEPDGSFRRVIDNDLFRNSLQGFIWLPNGRFLAYYFGAFGEPVQYVTGSVDGQRISRALSASVPSLTVPGVTPDAQRVVISAEIDGVTGYYLRSTVFESTELLFEAERENIPGNNWPAPAYLQFPDQTAYIYLARPIDGEPRLQCFDMQSRELYDVAPLPLQISDQERAWMWPSPDNATLALGANGVNGGLWTLDLAALPCTG